jgi:hypothetical protein
VYLYHIRHKFWCISNAMAGTLQLRFSNAHELWEGPLPSASRNRTWRATKPRTKCSSVKI